jgi:hypothetical protein
MVQLIVEYQSLQRQFSTRISLPVYRDPITQ